jgi:putative tricarboxylic transport membrane protein
VTRPGGRVVGLAMALVGLVAVGLGSQLREGTATGGPGTRFLPVLLGLIVIVLGAGIALRPGASEATEEVPTPGGAGRVAWTLGAIVAYVLALGPLGFLLATVPFLAVLFLVYGERRWPVVLAVALGATGATYGLFAVWLGVPLPPGLLGR